MTFITAHQTPIRTRYVLEGCDWTLIEVPTMIRRIAGLTTKTMHIDILHNRAGVIRASWDASFTLGTFTIAIVKKAEAR